MENKNKNHPRHIESPSGWLSIGNDNCFFGDMPFYIRENDNQICAVAFSKRQANLACKEKIESAFLKRGETPPKIDTGKITAELRGFVLSGYSIEIRGNNGEYIYAI